MSKHTPGPWASRSSHNGNIFSAFITSTSRSEIAFVSMLPCKEPTDYSAECAAIEEQANARLIAAAPELLEALKEAKQVLETAKQYFPKSIKNSDTFSLMNVLANSVNPAIAKAGA